MIRINLLPHREEKRRARRYQFYSLAGATVLLGGLIAILVHGIIAGYISTQQAKNEFLKKEIAVLDKEIDEIKRLKEQTEALLSRKQVIEALQANRAEAVHLFNELARNVPEGVYLRGIKQAGQKIALTGYAQSNARVSTLMRNLDGSPFLEQPSLVVIQAATVNSRRASDFNLNVGITRETKDATQAVGSGGATGGSPQPSPAKGPAQSAAGGTKT